MKKIAIRVNNKLEFDSLKSHFIIKTWIENENSCIVGYSKEYCIIEYKDRYLQIPESNIIATNQYEILDFSTFSQIAGIEVVNEVKISLNKGLAIVKQNSVYFEGNPCDFNLSGRHLEEIYAAYKSLQ